jgi:hypothetical protein
MSALKRKSMSAIKKKSMLNQYQDSRSTDLDPNPGPPEHREVLKFHHYVQNNCTYLTTIYSWNWADGWMAPCVLGVFIQTTQMAPCVLGVFIQTTEMAPCV